MGRLDGKVSIITGASRGMGASHAREFVMHGSKVVLTDCNEDAGRALADELGDNAIFVAQDVANAADWTRVVAATEKAFGFVSVLVNNAGILGTVSNTVDFTEEDYLKVISVNQNALFLGMKSVIPSMLRAGGGSIINISSNAGITCIYGTPNIAYAASKWAVRGMSKMVAVEYGPEGIRCNSVHPGYTMTPMMIEATDEVGGDALLMIPLRRISEPVEVSHLVVFLASDESSFVTGAEYVIDGGMTSH